MTTTTKLSQHINKFRVQHDIENFGWDGKTRTFSAFASDLGQMADRLYNDSCDYGFTIINRKTGNEVAFVLVRTMADVDDIQGWEFVSVDSKLKKMHVTIFND